MGTPKLDQGLLKKAAVKAGLSVKSFREAISRQAADSGISCEAVLIIRARRLEIGTGRYLARLESSVREEVREGLRMGGDNGVPAQSGGNRHVRPPKKVPGRPASIRQVIRLLVENNELYGRTGDLLTRSSKVDRAINQATLVLEDTIRKKAEVGHGERLEGTKLVNVVCKDDLSQTKLQLSDNPDEQTGFTNILRGIMLAFRNPTHHHLIESFTREDALRICAFIDLLLRVVERAKVRAVP